MQMSVGLLQMEFRARRGSDSPLPSVSGYSSIVLPAPSHVEGAWALAGIGVCRGLV